MAVHKAGKEKGKLSASARAERRRAERALVYPSGTSERDRRDSPVPRGPFWLHELLDPLLLACLLELA